MRTWKCRVCGLDNPRLFTKCQNLVDSSHAGLGGGVGLPVVCSGRKPPKRVPAHMQALNELPYEWWVEEFGERCGICGREPSARRRLDRDHCHKTGEPRGLLCHRCNRALPSHIDLAWLRSAARYMELTSEAD